MSETRGEGPGTAPPALTSRRQSEREDLIAFLERYTGVEQIQLATGLGPDLGLDSLGVVELLAAIEAELALNVAHVLADEESTVGELAEQVFGSRPVGPGFKGGRWPLSRLVVAVRALLQWSLLFPLVAVLSRRRVRGTEHLRDTLGPVLFAANHLSLLDNPAVLAALPWRWRLRLATAASDHVLDQRGRFQRFIAVLISNAFPLSQTSSVRPSMQYCRWLVGEGWSILYFPEGMRSDDGSMLRFKRGIGLLAVELGVPVVPVLLKGTNDVMPKGGTRPRRGVIEVSFGAPLRFGRREDHSAAADTIRRAISALAGGADR